MAQTDACSQQFEVTDPRWTECVHDQATAGGLMPWIVVVPLGVMVIGMMIGFARQFSSAGRARAKAHGAAGTAGTWLIFVSFIELAIGIGSWIGDRRAPGAGGYSIAAVVLLGVGAVLFVVGVFLKIKGRRRARIFHSGVPGEAVIRAVHETGTMVNNQPMYAFDLDVTGQGMSPVSTTHREVVPFWFLNRVGPQARVPVKVDPQNPTRVIFDWDALATMAGNQAAAGVASHVSAGGAGTPVTPEAAREMAESLTANAGVMQAAQQLQGSGRSEWHLGRVIGLAIGLFILVVVGGALFFVVRVFGQVSDVTSDVTGQVQDAVEDAKGAFGGGLGGGDRGNAAPTKIEVSRAAKGRDPVHFTVTLPAAWNDVTAAVEENQGAVVVDLVMKPQAPSEARIVVARSVRYLEDPAPAKADIGSIRAELEREFGDSLERSRTVRLAGEPAVALDIAPGADGLRSRQIAVMRGGQVIFVNLAAPKSEWTAMLKVFDDVVGSWNWGTVSA